MSENGPPRPPLTSEALEILAESIEDDDGIPIEDAVARLQAEGFTEADARDVLQQLLLDGQLYEVNQRVFITL